MVWRMDDRQRGTGVTVKTSVGGGRGTEMEVWLTGSVTGRVQKARAEMKGGGGRREDRVVGGGGGGGGGGRWIRTESGVGVGPGG